MKIRELDSQILKFYQQDRHALVRSGLAYLAGWLTDATELLLVSRLLDFPLAFGECIAIESFISVSKALGISFKHHSGHSLLSRDLFIAEDDFVLNKKDVALSPRIGVDYAGEDASLPYRFYIKGNPFVSGKPK